MTIDFAGKQLPEEAATDHFCFIGSTGSGKTVLIRRLMQSVFPNNIGIKDRAIIYDVKNEMLPIISKIVGNPDLVKTINPFDERCFAWDMAKDITEPAHALEFASILIEPEENSSQPFFSDSARHLLAGVITAFLYTDQKSEKKWTFRDVMFVMFQKELLKQLLLVTDETKPFAELYFGNEKTTKDIMSTIATKLAPFRLIASLWDYRLQQNPNAHFSLDNWLKKGFVLVLGNSHTNQMAVNAINRVIFKRASQMILDQEEAPKHINTVSRTWMVLDEFVRIGKLDGVVQLATEGRSKGASIVLGFQDINGVRSIYGDEVAEEIIGQCGNLGILKLQSPATAQWASDFIGLSRDIVTNDGKSTTYNPNDMARTVNQNATTTDRLKVLPSEFRLLPKPSREKPDITGYFVSDKSPFNQQVKKYAIGGLFNNLVEDNKIKGFQPYQESKNAQRLRIWQRNETDEIKDDFKRLKLSALFKEVEQEEGLKKQTERDNEIQEIIQHIKWRGYQTAFDDVFYSQLSEREKETFSRYINNEVENIEAEFPSKEALQDALNNQERKVKNEDEQRF